MLQPEACRKMSRRVVKSIEEFYFWESRSPVSSELAAWKTMALDVTC